MVREAECVAFLQWALPRLRMRWSGFRKVRSQVCKRIGRRLRELALEDLAVYRSYLDSHQDEWSRLDAMCRITISRFFRDRRVFEALETEVLPTLAAAAVRRTGTTLRVWSCGCASGEEAYTLSMLWGARLTTGTPATDIEITATDADPSMLERARRGAYSAGSVRGLPEDLVRAGLDRVGEEYWVRDPIRQRVRWRCQDVRSQVPPGPFDLVMCRNLVLTYFDDELQLEVMSRVLETLRPGGALVIGSHEHLPELDVPCELWVAKLPIYRRTG